MKTRLSTEYCASMEHSIEEIKANIESAREKSPAHSAVTLLAATKTVPAEVINYATSHLGITDIGENRVQELLDKYDELDRENVNIHFIGTLQTNKVKYIIDKVCMIHSVDSLKLAREIDRQAKKAGLIMDVLIEVNIGEEENKGGVMPSQLDDLLASVCALENIRVRGLMTIAPNCDDKEDYKKYFAKTYQFFIDNLPQKIDNINGAVLSMGMSGSYEAAVESGSTMVRIGSLIFGQRA